MTQQIVKEGLTPDARPACSAMTRSWNILSRRQVRQLGGDRTRPPRGCDTAHEAVGGPSSEIPNLVWIIECRAKLVQVTHV